MKKLISLFLACSLIVTALSGCKGNTPENTTTQSNGTSASTTAKTENSSSTVPSEGTKPDASDTSATSANSSTSEGTSDTAQTELTTKADTTSATADKTTTTSKTTASTQKTTVTTKKDVVIDISTLGVTFSQPGGQFKNAFDLKLSAQTGAIIYYTTDGSDPATSATRKKYTAAISIKDRSGDKNVVSAVSPTLFDAANVEVNRTRNGFTNTNANDIPSDSAVDKCTVIRAVATDGKGNYSATKTSTYFIGNMTDHINGISESCSASGEDLAIISISMDYDDLFDYNTGIYVKGKVFDESLASYIDGGQWLIPDTSRRLEANYNQRGREWERNVHIDYFESNGKTTECPVSQDCGIRIQGNYSRSDWLKGFRLYAREEYGKKNFKYAFFGEELKNDAGETIDKFKTLTLRNGGNGAFLAKYNDTYWQSMVTDLECETQTSRPCVVYVNGEYWGLYVLQEDYTDNYFEETHGVNNDEVIVYKGDAEKYVDLGYKLDVGDLPTGVTDESYYFSDLLKFMSSHTSLESQSDYNAFIKLVDPQSAMDYFAVECWINNKWDWPGKNWSLWKTKTVDTGNPYADGRWRFCFYDVEFGGISGSSDIYTNTIKEDNYTKYGLLDFDTKNPAVRIFAYLMTNEGFRTDFMAKLSGLSSSNFEKTHALEVLKTFKNTYAPLYEQFFNRYPGSGSENDAVSGGYGSYECIRAFVSGRAGAIKTQISYIQNHYK